MKDETTMWGPVELSELLTGFDNGVPLQTLAIALDRTALAVAAKLVQQGRLVWVNGTYVKTWASRGEVTRVDRLIKEG